MQARLDLRLDVVDTFGAEFMLDAKSVGRRSGTTLKLDPSQEKVAGNVLGDLNMSLDRCDLHHAVVTLSSEVEGTTWSRTVTLELGRKITLKLPDFLGDTNAAPVIEAINDVQLDGTETATVNLVASDPNETDDLSFSSPDLPSWGTLTDNGDGTGNIVFDPAAGDEGEYEITVEVSDSMVTTSTTFNVSVGAGVASVQGEEFTGHDMSQKDVPEATATKQSGGGVEDQAEESEEKQEESSEEPDFKNLSVKNLDNLLENYTLSGEGKKAEKVERLEDHYANASDEEKASIRKDVGEL